MTLPEQSDRAVAATRGFLVRLSSPYVEDGIKGIRREVRAEAVRLLRHYPHASFLARTGSNSRQTRDDAAEYTDGGRLATAQVVAENATICGLTSEERWALEVSIRILSDGGWGTSRLRGLLKRLGGGNASQKPEETKTR